jgi:PAS domain S-box-containing protein
VTDLDGTISFWNRGAEEIYGWRSEEAVGRNARELLQTAPHTNLDDIRAVIHQQGQWEGEMTEVTRSGENVIVASRRSLRSDDQGNPGPILEINRDITDSERAEDDLRQNRRRLALAMKAGRSGTFEWDNPALQLAGWTLMNDSHTGAWCTVRDVCDQRQTEPTSKLSYHAQEGLRVA